MIEPPWKNQPQHIFKPCFGLVREGQFLTHFLQAFTTCLDCLKASLSQIRREIKKKKHAHTMVKQYQVHARRFWSAPGRCTSKQTKWNKYGSLSIAICSLSSKTLCHRYSSCAWNRNHRGLPRATQQADMIQTYWMLLVSIREQSRGFNSILQKKKGLSEKSQHTHSTSLCRK